MNKIFDNQNLKTNLTKLLISLINSQKRQNYKESNSQKSEIKNNDSLDIYSTKLLIIQIGDNLASQKYANLKVKIGLKIGIQVNYYQYQLNGEVWQNGQKIVELWNNPEKENLKEKSEKIKTLTLERIELIKNHIKNLLKKTSQNLEKKIKKKEEQQKDNSKYNPKNELDIKNGLIFQLPLPIEFVDLLKIDWNNFTDVDFLAPNCSLWDYLLPPTTQAIDLVLKSLLWSKKLEHLKVGQNMNNFYTDLQASSLSQNLESKIENQENQQIELVLTKDLLTQKLDLTGKIVVVIGQGKLVGNPLLIYLQKRNATIISLNKDSPNKPKLVKNADIVICASGVPKLVQSSWFKKNTIIIDAATSESNGILVGDLDYLEITQSEFSTQNLPIEDLNQLNKQNLVENSQTKNKIKSLKIKSLNLQICPSPGGIGPLTVLCIFWNLIAIKK